MKWTVVTLIVLGVIAAGAASVLTSSLRAQRTAEAGADGATRTPQVQIVVAARDLPAMGLIEASSVTQKTIPEALEHAGALSSPLQVVGQILTVPMVEGQPFRQADLAGEVLGLNLAATLPQGLRAMTISLAGDAGIKGLLYPGCLVDVVASFRLPSARGSITGEFVSATLLQGVTVLAIGNRSTVSNPTTAAEAAESAPNAGRAAVGLAGKRGSKAEASSASSWSSRMPFAPPSPVTPIVPPFRRLQSRRV